MSCFRRRNCTLDTCGSDTWQLPFLADVSRVQNIRCACIPVYVFFLKWYHSISVIKHIKSIIELTKKSKNTGTWSCKQGLIERWIKLSALMCKYFTLIYHKLYSIFLRNKKVTFLRSKGCFLTGVLCKLMMIQLKCNFVIMNILLHLILLCKRNMQCT